MRKILALSLAICLTYMFTAIGSVVPVAHADDQYQDSGYGAYTPDQLDNLLAPVALYPDPLLAQVLLASTFPDQIQDAAGWVNRYGANNSGIDSQSWDVSVKAVAHYPTVLSMMNDQLDWTIAVGQAYVNQSADVMGSVQHLRQLARAEGNLFSTPQQQVIVDGGYIEIVPAEPRFIFVPTYDPGVIYSRRVYAGNSFGGFFSFGSGFAIGAWLNYDLDWGSRRVVYDNWQGTGWRQRSRPYVQVTNVYVNNRYQNVVINRTVVNRQVNYQNVDRFNSVHHDVKFNNSARIDNRPGNQPNNNNVNRNPRTMQPTQPARPNMDNNRGQRQNQNPPAAPQQPPQASRQDNNRGQQRPDQAPPATVQPSQPARPNINNNGGHGQGQVPPAAPQQAPQAPRQDNNRGQQRPDQAPPATVQPSQPARPNMNNNGGHGQGQAPPAAPQQPPQASRQDNNRGQQRPDQAPPATVQPSQPARPNMNNIGGHGQGQAPPAAPQQQAPQAPQQNGNADRGQQHNQTPPASVQKPAAPPKNGNQSQAQGDHGKSKDNKDNKDQHDH